MKLLMVASAPMEFRGILTRMEAPSRVSLPVDWARRGRLRVDDVLLVANGVGRHRAAAAADVAIGYFAPDRVVSIGYCGALDPQLRVADVVVGTCVADQSRRYPVLPVTGTAAAAGAICSIDRIARTAAEKRELRSGGAIAVEMEAAGVAERAQTALLPFSCVRVVTDLAGEDMANDFNPALRSDGHFDTMRILRDSLRQPTARIPELVRLQQRCARASRTLGDFFDDCRF